MQERGEVRPDVAKALDGHVQVRGLPAPCLGKRVENHSAAERSCRGPPPTPPEFERLAGDDTRCVFAGLLLVLVHHPGHHLRAGVDVRSRDVGLRSDDVGVLGDVGPGEPFALTHREATRVDLDAAFCATKGDIDDGTL